MDVRAQSAAVIPCLNEERTIAAVVKGALVHTAAVWAIDDASSDATSRLAEAAGASVIRHSANLGKGASLRDGLGAARAAGYKWAVTLDGDGQHDPAEIPRLLDLAACGADLVIGDRMSQSNPMPRSRRFVNRWMSARLANRLRIDCPDSQCGFRVVRLDAWAALTLRQNRFEVESEMIVAFARTGLKIAWIPVRSLPAQRRSRIHPIADTARWFIWWFNLQ